jgi:hypothetical protein
MLGRAFFTVKHFRPSVVGQLPVIRLYVQVEFVEEKCPNAPTESIRQRIGEYVGCLAAVGAE